MFQPHRFSRTKSLYKNFIKVLSKIDILYIQNIYPAGEKPIKNINSKKIVKELRLKNKNVYFLNKKNNIKNVLEEYSKEENIIIFMGAGTITNDAHDLIKNV